MKRNEFWCIVPFRVRYAEADQQGLLFNSHYLMYFDTVIVEYFRGLPYELQTSKGAKCDFHVVRALVEYRKPVYFDQEIDLGARVRRLGRSSITFELCMFGHDSSELSASGEVVWVNTEQRTKTAVPIPQQLRELIQQRERLGH